MKIINSFYVLPAVLDWINSTNKNREIPTKVWKIFEEAGITLEDLNEALKVEHLIKYNYGFMFDRKPDYDQLRRGLDQYFHAYLSGIFRKLKIIDQEVEFLDYGSGSGCYSVQFKKDNPLSTVTMLDRKEGLKIDFEEFPEWWYDHTSKYDIVLMSELLHCKDDRGRDYLLRSSKAVLKNRGLLIINENDDPAMNYRLDELSNGGSSMSPAETIILVQSHDFKLIKSLTINYHTIHVYQKQ